MACPWPRRLHSGAVWGFFLPPYGSDWKSSRLEQYANHHCFVRLELLELLCFGPCLFFRSSDSIWTVRYIYDVVQREAAALCLLRNCTTALTFALLFYTVFFLHPYHFICVRANCFQSGLVRNYYDRVHIFASYQIGMTIMKRVLTKVSCWVDEIV